MKISGIYKIESRLKPEKIYIGSATNIGKRWNLHLEHLRKNIHYNKKLQRHFNKYGEIDLDFSVLLGCNKESLLQIEQYFIDSYKPYFNNCMFAYSRLGQKASNETKKKISESRKGRIVSLETRMKISKANKGYKNTPEQREAQSKRQLGKKRGPRNKLKIA